VEAEREVTGAVSGLALEHGRSVYRFRLARGGIARVVFVLNAALSKPRATV